MATRINLRGVIVPSIYDTDWTQSYIERGIITPESAFRRDMDAVDGDVEIYVSSPGGSVFAGYEMSNAANERAAKGDKITIVVGSMAASAAANFLLQTHSSGITAHSNAKIMFHGATVTMDGGKEALEDEAELLGKINDEMKVALVTKHELDADMVDGWFAEGREGWLTATEAKDAKIVDSIIGEAAEVVEFPTGDIEDLARHGLQLAAFCAVGETTEDEPETEPESTDDEPEAPEDEAPADITDDSNDTAADDDPDDGDTGDPAGEDQPEDEPEPEVIEPEDEEATVITVDFETLGDENLRVQLAEQAEAHKTELAKRDELISTWQGKCDRLNNDVKQANTKVDELNARLDKLLGPALTFDTTPEASTWEDAVAMADGDYAQARKDHPALYGAWMDHKQKQAR